MIEKNMKLTPSAVGMLIKEMVRRAIVFVRNERMAFELTRKESYSGNMDDVFTSADTGAQKLYVKSIEECFPGVGIIGEEGNLIQGISKDNYYFTLDPVDGTKAFVRKQSHGISTMIALVFGDDVVSAYIGDINSNEIYGYRPDSQKVHRITEYNVAEELTYLDQPLTEQAILLRDSKDSYSKSAQDIIPKFKKALVDGASIGTWMARLWKREVAAVIISPSHETPWDSTPIWGISKKLGYIFLRPSTDGWVEYKPELVTEVTMRNHEVLVIHPNDYNKI